MHTTNRLDQQAFGGITEDDGAIACKVCLRLTTPGYCIYHLNGKSLCDCQGSLETTDTTGNGVLQNEYRIPGISRRCSTGRTGHPQNESDKRHCQRYES